jgi:hypothetical protein
MWGRVPSYVDISEPSVFINAYKQLTRDLNCFVSFRFDFFFFVVVDEASALSLFPSSDSTFFALTVFRFFFALPSSSLSFDAVALDFPFDFGVGLSSSSCLVSDFRFLFTFLAGGFRVSSSSEGGSSS